ncbi:putative transcription factor NAM family [Medicago truncatula]|uniref:NAC transcription factor-like protein n=1 Tax=Medicago truncatula TaxID=3880 RepID=G7LE35_MEDTR|nr:NAC domain-containing protein 104 [Medicago truncatula]AET04757.1 NAC transcription factor-like protein [Medicago truncatula]RHN43121.1 putative transcription factor NAM family [Medicago truncatula]
MMGSESSVKLPPGFYFSPTDEELVLHFLYSKASLPYHPNIIPELHLSHHDPWEIYGKALSSENEHYFFTEVKENRSTENGYWKEIGVTKPINKLGMKKYLVFNLGEGIETSWVMEEYHISSSPDENWSKWVLCKVYEKEKKMSQEGASCCYSDEDIDDNGTDVSWLDEVFMSLDDDDLDQTSLPN